MKKAILAALAAIPIFCFSCRLAHPAADSSDFVTITDVVPDAIL